MEDMVFMPGKGWINAGKIEDSGLQLDLGYIDRDGELVECSYGCHEELATEIVRKNGWEDEALAYPSTLWSDYLVMNRGYVQVDWLQGEGYLTYGKPLTKRQKDLVAVYVANGFSEHDRGSWMVGGNENETDLL